MITIDDSALAAVDAVRELLIAELGSEQVGAHVEGVVEADGVVTHYFACERPAYRGWRWAITVAHVPGGEGMTLDEVVLVPGEEAIVAPAWVPWRERIRPGDLSPGDVLPVEEDDARLVPAYLSGDPGDDVPEDSAERQQYTAVGAELGMGRVRVLSVEGRDAAAQRWFEGDAGPNVPLAQSAPGRCHSCGFLVRLSGPLAARFGVCANEHANDDGRVVALQHGCGAHSQAQLRKKQLPQPLPDPVMDTLSEDDFEKF